MSRLRRLVRKAESELFDSYFIENLVEDDMIKTEEYAKLTPEEAQTRDYPGTPAILEVYYTGVIDINSLPDEKQRQNVQLLIDDEYFKEMLRRDLYYTIENKGVLDKQELQDIDRSIFDDAELDIKLENDKIIVEVSCICY